MRRLRHRHRRRTRVIAHVSHRLLVRAGELLLALLAVLAAAVGARAAGPTLRAVTYHGFTARIPSSWPVYRLTGSRTCARFDRHALYLGVPGAQQQCPTGFGVAPRPVSDDEVGLAGDLRQFVEDLVRAAKANGLDPRHGFM